MSRRKLRNEKKCLNCGTLLTDRFCSHCGQENIINRPTFGYLFKEFFSDLIHFDGKSWQTLKILLFKPGLLVNEFLSGKRKSYVAPVKLYIFISLVSFLLPSIIGNIGKTVNIDIDNKETDKQLIASELEKTDPKTKETLLLLDSIQNALPKGHRIDEKTFLYLNEAIKNPKKKDSIAKALGYGNAQGLTIGDDLMVLDDYKEYNKAKTVQQFDSIHNSLPKEKRLSYWERPFYRKAIQMNEEKQMSTKEFVLKFRDSFVHNFPRVLIFYLPIFAFVLWLFHNKKKWFYYDHGVFTLYFFSFLLLLTSIDKIFDKIISLPTILYPGFESIANFLEISFWVIVLCYAIFYLFRSHSKVYGESKFISRLKVIMIFWINFFVFLFILFGFTLITYLIM